MAWVRPGHIGYIGPDLGVDPHSPSVAMLSVGLEAPLIVHTAAHGQIRTGSSFAPARTTQRAVATKGWILTLFVEPVGATATAIGNEMTASIGPFGLSHRRERELVELCLAEHVDPDRIYARAIAGPAPVDPRIEHVAAIIRTDPAQTFRADRIAANLGLSTTHFLRLFTQQYGTSFRGYQRWNRMVHTVRNAVTGQDLTRSAIDAGFATPSHFSETFRDMIGLPATTILRAGIHFDLGTSPAP